VSNFSEYYQTKSKVPLMAHRSRLWSCLLLNLWLYLPLLTSSCYMPQTSYSSFSWIADFVLVLPSVHVLFLQTSTRFIYFKSLFHCLLREAFSNCLFKIANCPSFSFIWFILPLMYHHKYALSTPLHTHTRTHTHTHTNANFIRTEIAVGFSHYVIPAAWNMLGI
jgi:hypothetical protein